jgi:hypothetical protein
MVGRDRGRSPGQTLSVSLPPGSYVFTLMATADSQRMPSSSPSSDNAPPAIQSVTATPSVITQANHEMVSVVVSVSVSDCDPAVSCRIVSVTSNEPEQGIGDGDTSPDWEITGNLMLNVRAGNGPDVFTRSRLRAGMQQGTSQRRT